MDRDLMQRPPSERAKEFRALAKNARAEARMAVGTIGTSLLKIAEEWDSLAAKAEAETEGTA